MKRKILILLALVALCTSATAANLLVNPGFEASLFAYTFGAWPAPGDASQPLLQNSWNCVVPNWGPGVAHAEFVSELSNSSGAFEGEPYNGDPGRYNGVDSLLMRNWGPVNGIIPLMVAYQDVPVTGGLTYAAGALAGALWDPARANWAAPDHAWGAGGNGFGSNLADYARIEITEFKADMTSNGTIIGPGITSGTPTLAWNLLSQTVQTKNDTAFLRLALKANINEKYYPAAIWGPAGQGWVVWDDAFVNAVPEPGSLVVLCSGLFGLAGLAIRRRK